MNNAPRIGDVQDGFTFIGGNPADQNSWRQQTNFAPDTLQEQHPDITWKDRLITKNLATSPEAIMAYLQKEHPNLQIESNDKGDIRVKRPDENQFRVLDPDTGVTGGLAENLKDIGDVGYDVLSGIGTGVATAAGGLAGAPTVAGALPAAAGAGAAASGGLEALRQALGSAAGIKDNMDLGQIGGATAAGAISPLLFGTGATLANAEGKGLTASLAKGLGAELAPETAQALMSSQRGLPSRAVGGLIDKFAPTLASKLSGVTKGDVQDLQKNIGLIKGFESNPDAVEELATTTVRDAAEKFKNLETAAYHEVVDATGSKGIDVKEAIQPWLEKRRALAQAASAEGASPFQKKAFDEFKATFNDLWGSPKLQEESFFTKTPEQFRSIQQRIAELADFDSGLKIRSKVADMNPAEKIIALTAKDSYAGMNKSLEKISKDVPGLKKNLAEIIRAREFLHKKIGSPEQFVTRMRQASSDKLEHKILGNRLKEIGTLIGSNGLDDARGLINAADKFGASTPWLSQKRIPAAVLGAVGGYAANRGIQGQGEGFNLPGITMGAALGGALGGPRAIRALIDFSRNTGGNYIAPYAAKLGSKTLQSAWRGMNGE